MKATEFVKKYGWDAAKEYLAGATFFNDNLFVFTDATDLQNLVNAYELAESYGGIEKAKDTYRMEVHESGGLIYGLAFDIIQSIELVESCT